VRRTALPHGLLFFFFVRPAYRLDPARAMRTGMDKKSRPRAVFTSLKDVICAQPTQKIPPTQQ
jgi:hypothetical protein